jgi:hypothetical protein
MLVGVFVWANNPKKNTMPVIITACVSKKVGQANYGSAGFSLTVQSEVSNLDQVQVESHRLYELLNHSVNRELFEASNGETQKAVPLETIHEEQPHQQLQNGHHNGHANGHLNGYANGLANNHSQRIEQRRHPAAAIQREWKASDKQREFLCRIIKDNHLESSEVEELAFEMFGTGDLPALNKLQASGLIDELISRYGKKQRPETTSATRFNARRDR